MKEKKDQKEWFESCHYHMNDEGVDYCFEGYSSWSEIKDEEFHKLRLVYLDAVKKLREYVSEKAK